jgi:hypothetical protein
MVTLILIIGWSIWGVIQMVIGPTLLLYLVPTLLSIGFLPFVAYRAYALSRAIYILEREGIRLKWGLRVENIPMDTVQWVYRQKEYKGSLPLPRLRWPGSVMGIRRLPDGNTIEYMASNANQLILIGTKDRTFAVSPDDPDDFLSSFQNLMEFASLTPIDASSIYPSFLLARIWQARAARYLILAGLVVNMLLLAWVLLAIPSHPSIILGFAPGRNPISGLRLFLLPLISAFIFSLDLLLGLFFFRREGYQSQMTETGNDVSLVPGGILAYLFWGSGLITALLLIAAVYFILGTG